MNSFTVALWNRIFNGLQQMSISDYILAVTAIFIFWYAWETRKLKQEMVKQTVYQSLLSLQKDYRSPQMLYAVRTLWDFYREHGKEKFVEKYEEIRNEERIWITNIDKQKRIEAEQSTLHYQRRLVSQFYNQLATLYVNGVLPKDIVYRNWPEADLRIIPEILIPIENKLCEVLHQPPLPLLGENSDLMVLYRGSKDC
jgi:hypothetical protein